MNLGKNSVWGRGRLSLIVGVVLMMSAVLVTTRLAQQNQENRGQAAPKMSKEEKQAHKEAEEKKEKRKEQESEVKPPSAYDIQQAQNAAEKAAREAAEAQALADEKANSAAAAKKAALAEKEAKEASDLLEKMKEEAKPTGIPIAMAPRTTVMPLSGPNGGCGHDNECGGECAYCGPGGRCVSGCTVGKAIILDVGKQFPEAPGSVPVATQAPVKSVSQNENVVGPTVAVPTVAVNPLLAPAQTKVNGCASGYYAGEYGGCFQVFTGIPNTDPAKGAVTVVKKINGITQVIVNGYEMVNKDGTVNSAAKQFKTPSDQIKIVDDLAKGDKTALVQKCRDNKGSGCDSMTIEALVGAYAPLYKDQAQQIATDYNKINQAKLAVEVAGKSDSEIVAAACKGDAECLKRVDVRSILRGSGLTAAEVDKIMFQRGAIEFLTNYQNGQSIKDEEIISRCVALGGKNCGGKQSAMESLVGLVGNDKLTASQIEQDRQKTIDNMAAYGRIENTLKNLGSYEGAAAAVASGKDTWVEIEKKLAEKKADPLLNVVITWNDLTGGRFKRGNYLLMEGVDKAGPNATIFGGSLVNPFIVNNIAGDIAAGIITGNEALVRKRTEALGKVAMGSLAQGGDAAGLAVAIAAAPLAAPVAGAVGVGGVAAATLGTGFGVAATTQMTGMAADTCSQVGKKGITQKNCNETIALAAVSAAGTGLGTITSTAARATRLFKAAEMATETVGGITFTDMAVETCQQSNWQGLDCASSVAMAVASGGKLVGTVGGAAMSAESAALVAKSGGAVAMQVTHKVSAGLFLASACSKLGDGSLWTTDSVSMCAMGVSGAMQASGLVKEPVSGETKTSEVKATADPLVRLEELRRNWENTTEPQAKEVARRTYEAEVKQYEAGLETNNRPETARSNRVAELEQEVAKWQKMAESMESASGGHVPESVRQGLERAETALAEAQANQSRTVTETTNEVKDKKNNQPEAVADTNSRNGSGSWIDKMREALQTALQPKEKTVEVKVKIEVSSEARETLREAGVEAKKVIGEDGGVFVREKGTNKLVVNDKTITNQAMRDQYQTAIDELNAIVDGLEAMGKKYKSSKSFALTNQQLTDFVQIATSDNPVLILSAQTGYGKSLVASQALTLYYADKGTPVMQIYADNNYRAGALGESFHEMYRQNGVDRVYFDKDVGWRRVEVDGKGNITYKSLSSAEVRVLMEKQKIAVMLSDDNLHFGIQQGGETGKLLEEMFDKAVVIADEGSKYIQAGKNYRTNLGEGKALLGMRAEDTALKMSFAEVQQMRAEVLKQPGITSLREQVMDNLRLGRSTEGVMDLNNKIPRDEKLISQIYRETVESSNSPRKTELLALSDAQLRQELLRMEKLGGDLPQKLSAINVEIAQLAEVPTITYAYGKDGVSYVLNEGKGGEGSTRQTKSTVLEILAANETGRQMYDLVSGRSGGAVGPAAPLDLANVKFYDQATQTNGLDLFLSKKEGTTIILDATPDLIAKGLGELRGAKVIGEAPPLVEARSVQGVASAKEAVMNLRPKTDLAFSDYLNLKETVVKDVQRLKEGYADPRDFDAALQKAKEAARTRRSGGGMATDPMGVLADKILVLDRAQLTYENVRILNTATGEVTSEVSRAIAEKYKGTRDHHIVNPDANEFKIIFREGGDLTFHDIAEYKKFVQENYYDAGAIKNGRDYVVEVQHRDTGLNLAVDKDARWIEINDINTKMDTAIQGTGRDRLYAEVVREMINRGTPPSMEHFDADLRNFLRDNPQFGNAELYGPDHYVVGAKENLTIAEMNQIYQSNQGKAERQTRQETLVKLVEARSRLAITEARDLALAAVEAQYGGFDPFGSNKAVREVKLAEINQFYQEKLREFTQESQLRAEIINDEAGHGGIALKSALENAQRNLNDLAGELQKQLNEAGAGKSFEDFSKEWKVGQKLGEADPATGIKFTEGRNGGPVSEKKNFIDLEAAIADRYIAEDLPAENRRGANQVTVIAQTEKTGEQSVGSGPGDIGGGGNGGNGPVGGPNNGGNGNGSQTNDRVPRPDSAVRRFAETEGTKLGVRPGTINTNEDWDNYVRSVNEARSRLVAEIKKADPEYNTAGKTTDELLVKRTLVGNVGVGERKAPEPEVKKDNDRVPQVGSSERNSIESAARALGVELEPEYNNQSWADLEQRVDQERQKLVAEIKKLDANYNPQGKTAADLIRDKQQLEDAQVQAEKKRKADELERIRKERGKQAVEKKAEEQRQRDQRKAEIEEEIRGLNQVNRDQSSIETARRLLSDARGYGVEAGLITKLARLINAAVVEDETERLENERQNKLTELIFRLRSEFGRDFNVEGTMEEIEARGELARQARARYGSKFSVTGTTAQIEARMAEEEKRVNLLSEFSKFHEVDEANLEAAEDLANRAKDLLVGSRELTELNRRIAAEVRRAEIRKARNEEIARQREAEEQRKLAELTAAGLKAEGKQLGIKIFPGDSAETFRQQLDRARKWREENPNLWIVVGDGEYFYDIETTVYNSLLKQGKYEEAAAMVPMMRVGWWSDISNNLAEKLYGQALTPGLFGATFLDKATGTITKIFRRPRGVIEGRDMEETQEYFARENKQQVEFYRKWSGQIPWVVFKGLVGGGFQQEYIENSQSLGDFYKSGGIVTRKMMDEFLNNLEKIHRVTGQAHGDLFSNHNQWPQLFNVSYGNILVQNMPDGSRRLVAIDFAGTSDKAAGENLADPVFIAEEMNRVKAGLEQLVGQYESGARKYLEGLKVEIKEDQDPVQLMEETRRRVIALGKEGYHLKPGESFADFEKRVAEQKLAEAARLAAAQKVARGMGLVWENKTAVELEADIEVAVKKQARAKAEEDKRQKELEQLAYERSQEVQKQQQNEKAKLKEVEVPEAPKSIEEDPEKVAQKSREQAAEVEAARQKAEEMEKNKAKEKERLSKINEQENELIKRKNSILGKYKNYGLVIDSSEITTDEEIKELEDWADQLSMMPDYRSDKFFEDVLRYSRMDQNLTLQLGEALDRYMQFRPGAEMARMPNIVWLKMAEELKLKIENMKADSKIFWYKVDLSQDISIIPFFIKNNDGSYRIMVGRNNDAVRIEILGSDNEWNTHIRGSIPQGSRVRFVWLEGISWQNALISGTYVLDAEEVGVYRQVSSLDEKIAETHEYKKTVKIIPENDIDFLDRETGEVLSADKLVFADSEKKTLLVRDKDGAVYEMILDNGKLYQKYFDPKAEYNEILSKRKNVSRDEVRQMIQDYRENNSRLEQALTNMELEIMAQVDAGSNLTLPQLRTIFLRWSKDVGIPQEYWLKIVDAYNRYTERQKSVARLMQNYQVTNYDQTSEQTAKRIFKDIYGVEPTGAVDVNFFGLGLEIVVDNPADYEVMVLRNRQANNVSDLEIKNTINSSGGFQNMTVVNGELISVIGSKRQVYSQLIRRHELRHALNSIFGWFNAAQLAVNFEIAEKLVKSSSLDFMTVIENETIFPRAKDELIAYLSTPDRDDKTLLEDLTRGAENGGIYDYYNEVIEKTENPYLRQIITERRKRYIELLNRSVMAFRVAQLKYGRKEALAMFSRQPLASWPTTLGRTIGQSEYRELLRQLEQKETAIVNSITNSSMSQEDMRKVVHFVAISLGYENRDKWLEVTQEYIQIFNDVIAKTNFVGGNTYNNMLKELGEAKIQGQVLDTDTQMYLLQSVSDVVWSNIELKKVRDIGMVYAVGSYDDNIPNSVEMAEEQLKSLYQQSGIVWGMNFESSTGMDLRVNWRQKDGSIDMKTFLDFRAKLRLIIVFKGYFVNRGNFLPQKTANFVEMVGEINKIYFASRPLPDEVLNMVNQIGLLTSSGDIAKTDLQITQRAGAELVYRQAKGWIDLKRDANNDKIDIDFYGLPSLDAARKLVEEVKINKLVEQYKQFGVERIGDETYEALKVRAEKIKALVNKGVVLGDNRNLTLEQVEELGDKVEKLEQKNGVGAAKGKSVTEIDSLLVVKKVDDATLVENIVKEYEKWRLGGSAAEFVRENQDKLAVVVSEATGLKDEELKVKIREIGKLAYEAVLEQIKTNLDKEPHVLLTHYYSQIPLDQRRESGELKEISVAHILDATINPGDNWRGAAQRQRRDFLSVVRFSQRLRDKLYDFADEMRRGDEPITVIDLGEGVYTVTEGTHRVLSAKIGGVRTIKAKVIKLKSHQNDPWALLPESIRREALGNLLEARDIAAKIVDKKEATEQSRGKILGTFDDSIVGVALAKVANELQEDARFQFYLPITKQRLVSALEERFWTEGPLSEDLRLPWIRLEVDIPELRKKLADTVTAQRSTDGYDNVTLNQELINVFNEFELNGERIMETLEGNTDLRPGGRSIAGGMLQGADNSFYSSEQGDIYTAMIISTVERMLDEQWQNVEMAQRTVGKAQEELRQDQNYQMSRLLTDEEIRKVIEVEKYSLDEYKFEGITTEEEFVRQNPRIKQTMERVGLTWARHNQEVLDEAALEVASRIRMIWRERELIDRAENELLNTPGLLLPSNRENYNQYTDEEKQQISTILGVFGLNRARYERAEYVSADYDWVSECQKIVVAYNKKHEISLRKLRTDKRLNELGLVSRSFSNDEYEYLENFLNNINEYRRVNDLLPKVLSGGPNLERSTDLTFEVQVLLSPGPGVHGDEWKILVWLRDGLTRQLNEIIKTKRADGSIRLFSFIDQNNILLIRQEDGSYKITGPYNTYLTAEVISEGKLTKSVKAGEIVAFRDKRDGVPIMAFRIGDGGKLDSAETMEYVGTEMVYVWNENGTDYLDIGKKLAVEFGDMVESDGQGKYKFTPGGKLIVNDGKGHRQVINMLNRRGSGGLIGEVVGMELRVTEADTFDIALETQRITDLRGRISNEELHQRYEEINKRAADQENGYADFRIAVEAYIQKNPDATMEELEGLFGKYQKVYQWPTRYREEAGRIFKEYIGKHREVTELAKRYALNGGHYDAKRMYEDFFGVKPDGKVDVIIGPVSIGLGVELDEDYAIGYQWDHINGQKSRINVKLKEEALDSGGVALNNVKLPEAKDFVFLSRGLLNGDSSNRIYVHEERHKINRLIMSVRNGGIGAATKKMELEGVVGRIELRAYDYARDEIVAYVTDPSETEEDLLVTLTKLKEDKGLYDYFDVYIQNVSSYANTPELQKELVGRLQGDSARRHRLRIQNGLDSIQKLAHVMGSKEKAMRVLERQPLEKWPAIASRMYEEKKYVVAALGTSDNRQIEKKVAWLSAETGIPNLNLNAVEVMRNYRVIARAENIIRIKRSLEEMEKSSKLVDSQDIRDEVVKLSKQLETAKTELFSALGRSTFDEFTLYRPDYRETKEKIISREILGRSKHNGMLTGSEVSNQHLIVYRDEKGVIAVEDNSSANGTFINGRKLFGFSPVSSASVIVLGGIVNGHTLTVEKINGTWELVSETMGVVKGEVQMEMPVKAGKGGETGCTDCNWMVGYVLGQMDKIDQLREVGDVDGALRVLNQARDRVNGHTFANQTTQTGLLAALEVVEAEIKKTSAEKSDALRAVDLALQKMKEEVGGNGLDKSAKMAVEEYEKYLEGKKKTTEKLSVVESGIGEQIKIGIKKIQETSQRRLGDVVGDKDKVILPDAGEQTIKSEVDSSLGGHPYYVNEKVKVKLTEWGVNPEIVDKLVEVASQYTYFEPLSRLDQLLSKEVKLDIFEYKEKKYVYLDFDEGFNNKVDVLAGECSELSCRTFHNSKVREIINSAGGKIHLVIIDGQSPTHFNLPTSRHIFLGIVTDEMYKLGKYEDAIVFDPAFRVVVPLEHSGYVVSNPEVDAKAKGRDNGTYPIHVGTKFFVGNVDGKYELEDNEDQHFKTTQVLGASNDGRYIYYWGYAVADGNVLIPYVQLGDVDSQKVATFILGSNGELRGNNGKIELNGDTSATIVQLLKRAEEIKLNGGEVIVYKTNLSGDKDNPPLSNGRKNNSAIVNNAVSKSWFNADLFSKLINIDPLVIEEWRLNLFQIMMESRVWAPIALGEGGQDPLVYMALVNKTKELASDVRDLVAYLVKPVNTYFLVKQTEKMALAQGISKKDLASYRDAAKLLADYSFKDIWVRDGSYMDYAVDQARQLIRDNAAFTNRKWATDIVYLDIIRGKLTDSNKSILRTKAQKIDIYETTGLKQMSPDEGVILYESRLLPTMAKVDLSPNKDVSWRVKYTVEAERLDKIFGKFSQENVQRVRNSTDFLKVDPLVGENWGDKMRKSEDPVTSAIYFWSLYPDKDQYGSKKLLDQMISEFPDKAKMVQEATSWFYLHKCLNDNKPTVTMYRAVKVNYDPNQIRPWDSLTDNKDFAQRLCDKGDRVLATYEVPVENIFASYESNAGLALFENREKEILLNSKGGVGIQMTEVDNSGVVIVTLNKELDNLIETLSQEGVMYDQFIKDERYLTILSKLPQRARGTVDKKVKEAFNMSD